MRAPKRKKGHYAVERQDCWFTLLLLMMLAVPAFAQFEVSPDHFDNNPSSTQQANHSNSVTSLRLQIAEQKKLLDGYQEQLLQKSALVTKARQAIGNSGCRWRTLADREMDPIAKEAQTNAADLTIAPGAVLSLGAGQT